MKNDINLIYKRKNIKNSRYMTIGFIGGAVFLAVFAIVGVWLPVKAKTDAQSNLDSIRQQLDAFQLSDDEMLATASENQQLTEQLADLLLIQESRSDVLEYLEGIENALPAGACLTNISMLDNLLTITGVAHDDSEIAAFILHLKGSGLFTQVLLDSSTIGDDGHQTMFSLSVILPASLNGPAVVEQSGNDESTGENAAENSDNAAQQPGEVSP